MTTFKSPHQMSDVDRAAAALAASEANALESARDRARAVLATLEETAAEYRGEIDDIDQRVSALRDRQRELKEEVDRIANARDDAKKQYGKADSEVSAACRAAGVKRDKLLAEYERRRRALADLEPAMSAFAKHQSRIASWSEAEKERERMIRVARDRSVEVASEIEAEAKKRREISDSVESRIAALDIETSRMELQSLESQVADARSRYYRILKED